MSREGALDLRESQERRDKIFAEKQKTRQKIGSETAVSMGNFHFFGRGKTNVWGGITSKLAS